MSALTTSAGAEMQRWIRFTPAQRMARFAVFFVMAAAIAWALKTIEIIPEFLYDAPEQVVDMGTRMWPIDWAHFAPVVWPALIETLHIAAMATILGLIMGIPVGFLAARNATPFVWVNLIAKFILVATRSISTLIWALFFVAMFGPGPLAGALAIAFHSIGFIGKMFSEGVEEANKGSIEALASDRRDAHAANLDGLLAPSETHVLVCGALSLGHQRAGIRRARLGRCGWHRNGAERGH
jgi:phosphonate transport system permease protein